MSTEFTVRVGYVDDSYWDDGSRWTSQTFKFKAEEEAITFAREALTKGLKLRGQNGEVYARPDKDHICVRCHTTTEVDWNK